MKNVIVEKLSDRNPPLDPARLLADRVPPPQFTHARLDNYVPDGVYPSQHRALARIQETARQIRSKKPRRFRPFYKPAVVRNIYLDGGYGVGKTHLLAAIAHEVGPELCAYGSFMEYTHIIGALGYDRALVYLSTRDLVCIDEFELDDPGDTLMMTRLVRDLTAANIPVITTSNTLPEALGEGRFAAEDFQREIQSLSEHFDIIAIDGSDYRSRGMDGLPLVPVEGKIREVAEETPGASLDTFAELTSHLETLHPSRYSQLIDGVRWVGITGVEPITDTAQGLRIVVLIDRLYDRSVPMRIDLDPRELYSQELLEGGYRKKFLRSISRLTALARR